ncbi:MAG: hypothetical protein IT270_06110 [Saprospiraceae bacterium]|nr:hypothetical protein [Saprospiraceae bacterium]
MKRFHLILLLCAAAVFSAAAQGNDTLLLPAVVPGSDTLRLPKATVTDTLAPAEVQTNPFEKEGFFKKGYPNPRKAALMSFVLPGSGQIYNKKWWKVPIVYGTLGTLIWVEVTNIKQYRELRDNYLWVVDGDDNTFPTEYPYTVMDATRLKSYRDEWKKNVEISSLLLGLAYVLTATDAFVDAHLQRFDVTDDLTFRVRPVPAPGLVPAAGLTFNYALGTGRKYQTTGVVEDFSKP